MAAPTPEQLQTWLDAARDARHRLIVGELEVSIAGQDGQSLAFNRTTLKDLNAYIADLESQLDGTSAPSKGKIYRLTQTGTGY